MMTRFVLTAFALLLSAGAVPATPLACADPCEIAASDMGYVPPLAETASGTTLRWSTPDHTHAQVDTGRADACLGSVASPGAPGTATFVIRDGALFATSELGQELPCGNAVALPGGSFALPYRCALHPTMQGTLVVSAAA